MLRQSCSRVLAELAVLTDMCCSADALVLTIHSQIYPDTGLTGQVCMAAHMQHAHALYSFHI